MQPPVFFGGIPLDVFVHDSPLSFVRSETTLQHELGFFPQFDPNQSLDVKPYINRQNTDAAEAVASKN
jgi:hypothetical protein